MGVKIHGQWAEAAVVVKTELVVEGVVAGVGEVVEDRSGWSEQQKKEEKRLTGRQETHFLAAHFMRQVSSWDFLCNIFSNTA